MKTKNLNKHQVAILIATILFVLALSLFSCKKEEQIHQPQFQIGLWYIDTIIVNAPALSYDELIITLEPIEITIDTIFYDSGLVQAYTFKPNKLKFSPGTEYHPSNATITHMSPQRMVWDTNEKHRRIRRILHKL